jgi:hypothetical protein
MHISKGFAAKNPHSGLRISTINIADMLFLRDPFFRQSPQGQP